MVCALTRPLAWQAQQEHQSRERQLEEQVAALRHRLSGEVARFSSAAEAMQLAAVQEQQSLEQELDASQRKWQADLARAAERLAAAQAKVRLGCVLEVWVEVKRSAAVWSMAPRAYVASGAWAGMDAAGRQERLVLSAPSENRASLCMHGNQADALTRRSAATTCMGHTRISPAVKREADTSSMSRHAAWRTS